MYIYSVLDSVATELINKLNFLEDEDQEAPPAMSINPFDDPDDLHPNDLNPFGDPDEEGMFNSKHVKITHSVQFYWGGWKLTVILADFRLRSLSRNKS